MSGSPLRKAAPLAERGEDFYPTGIEAVLSLLALERPHLPRRIWEPACGDGAIVKPMRAAGYEVRASDLVDRGCPDSTVLDYMADRSAPTDGIVTNPPYKIAPAFLEKAIGQAPYVALLLRLLFLEGVTRKPLFEASPLARVHVASRRLPSMHRDGWAGPHASTAIAFAWFVWDARHVGPPTIGWFDWRNHASLRPSALAMEDLL